MHLLDANPLVEQILRLSLQGTDCLTPFQRFGGSFHCDPMLGNKRLPSLLANRQLAFAFLACKGPLGHLGFELKDRLLQLLALCDQLGLIQQFGGHRIGRLHAGCVSLRQFVPPLGRTGAVLGEHSKEPVACLLAGFPFLPRRNANFLGFAVPFALLGRPLAILRALLRSGFVQSLLPLVELLLPALDRWETCDRKSDQLLGCLTGNPPSLNSFL